MAISYHCARQYVRVVTYMPKIYPPLLDSVIYLYPSVADAKEGKRAGGCGFLMTVPSEDDEIISSIYAVTNSHVINEGQSPVIRLNTSEGASDVIELEAHDWSHHPEGDDIAVVLIDLPEGKYRTHTIAAGTCLRPMMLRWFKYGPGEDVFIISRFMTVGGKQTNQPVVRFGHLAMMPGEPIEHERGYKVESFLVESRSISGMSGSPVFIYVPLVEDFQLPGERDMMRESGNAKGPYLLGIDWSHLPIYENVLDEGGKPHPDGWRVKSNSGFMAVAPAWKLYDLLEDEDLLMERKKIGKAKREELDNTAVLDVTTPEFTKEKMQEAVTSVSRRRPKTSPRNKAS